MNSNAQILCNVCDCISLNNKGESEVNEIFNKYPYANVYKDRTATSHGASPGTTKICGDGKNQRYILNMFMKYYPGEEMYPNDNIYKRIEWFEKCLGDMLRWKTVESLAFPDYICKNEKFIDKVDNFCKKYYLKHKRELKIYDYKNNEIQLEREIEVNVDDGVNKLRTASSQYCFNCKTWK